MMNVLDRKYYIVVNLFLAGITIGSFSGCGRQDVETADEAPRIDSTYSQVEGAAQVELITPEVNDSMLADGSNAVHRKQDSVILVNKDILLIASEVKLKSTERDSVKTYIDTLESSMNLYNSGFESYRVEVWKSPLGYEGLPCKWKYHFAIRFGFGLYLCTGRNGEWFGFNWLEKSICG